MTVKIRAKFLRDGDTLTGLNNGYVFEEPEVGNGYLSYPSTHGGMAAAMPEDTILVGYHDSQGDENYLLIGANSYITVGGEDGEDDRVILDDLRGRDEEDDDE